MRLGDLVGGRDNNFNLIRITAAYAVLISHSFALTTGSAGAEPFHATMGLSIGSIAVDVFFLVSGFLVTASLLTRQDVFKFAVARFLRIFPALLVMLVVTVFVLGAVFSITPWPVYLTDAKTYKYLWKGATLFTGVAYSLPGVFQGNPFGDAVNGSLWTMSHEVRMYTILALIWLCCRGTTELFVSTAFKQVIVLIACSAWVLTILTRLHLISSVVEKYSYVLNLELLFMFFSGAAFFIFKDKIVLSHTTVVLLLVILSLSLVNTQLFFILYISTLPYLLFYCAYIPAGLIRQYNQLGDYSYGIYIYAFPVQQALIATIPGISIASVIIGSSIITMTLAVLSWHIVERRALQLKL